MNTVWGLHQYALRLRGGRGNKKFVLVHGYGCNQGVWKRLTPFLEQHGNVVLYDQIGSGNSDYKLYDRSRYNNLNAYAADLVSICEAMKLDDVVVIGHSVGATIAALACAQRPDLFSNLIMIAPSPCYINTETYVGGFAKWELEQLMDLMESDYIAWAEYLTPILMGRTKEDESVNELREWFCQIDRDIAKHFARVTFFSDHREDMKKVTTPTLIIQCTDDVIAPTEVGRFLSETIPTATLQALHLKGHCPHITHPLETSVAIKNYCLTSA